MPISLKRAYEAPARDDGCRILVERLWPRVWFGHEPSRWRAK